MKTFAKNQKVNFNKYKIQKDASLSGDFQVVDVPVKNRNSSVRNIYGLRKLDNGTLVGKGIYAHFRNLIAV